jgi:hypothetical protein
MVILFDTVSGRARIGAGVRSNVAVPCRLLARIEMFDGSIDGVAVRDSRERP